MLLEVRNTPTYLLPLSPPLTMIAVMIGTLFICFVGQMRQDKGIVAVEDWLTAVFRQFLCQLSARVEPATTATTILTTPPSPPSSTTSSSPTRINPSRPPSPSISNVSSAPSRSSSPPLSPIDPFSDDQSRSRSGRHESVLRGMTAESVEPYPSIPKSSVKVDDIRKEMELKIAVSKLNEFLVKRGAGGTRSDDMGGDQSFPEDAPHSEVESTGLVCTRADGEKRADCRS